MKFTFADKKVTLPPAVHGYAEKKIGKLDRYFKTEGDASVTFSVEKDRNQVEVTVRSGGMILRAAESTSDMKASIDACVTSIERQIRKHKTRLEKRLRTDVVEMEEPSDFAEVAPPAYAPMRTKRFALEMMSVEEAILQMSLLGHSFYAFKNGDDQGAFAVVYVRHDGTYGLIEDAV